MRNKRNIVEIQNDIQQEINHINTLLNQYGLTNNTRDELMSLRQKLYRDLNHVKELHSSLTEDQYLARKLQITPQRLRQILTAALKKIKHPAINRPLREYIKK